MIIDPYTGMPVSMTQPGSFASDAASQMGLQNHKGLMQMLNNAPSATTSMGWNAMRGGNTILRGGFSGNELNSGKFLRNTMMPHSFGRFSSIYGVDNTAAPLVRRRFGRSGERAPYSPFNILSDSANKGYNAVFNRGGEKRLMFSPGFVSRQNAAARIVSGNKYNTSKVLGNIGKLDPSIGTALAGNPEFAGSVSKLELSQLTAASMKGEMSLKASGYMSYLRSGNVTSEVASTLEGAGGKEAFILGSRAAANTLAKGALEKVGSQLVFKGGEQVGFAAARAGLSAALDVGVTEGLQVGGALGLEAVGLAIPGVNVVLAAKMAYDLTKMGTGLLTSFAQTGKDAVTSFKGSIGKPIMGMGYKDNTVAATSRARGVSAIQNSRLNARSALGSEAGAMAAHFG